MIKTILPTIALCILTVLLFNNDSSQDTPKRIAKSTHAKMKHPIKSPILDTINHSTRSTVEKIVEKKVLAKEEIFFQDADIDDVLLSMNMLDSIEPISAVSMPQENLKNVQVGDTIILPTIDGITHKVKINSRELTFFGNTTIIGSFEEEGATYTSIFTEGKGFALISMMTPEGNYEVEMSQGIGLVYSTADIENSRIDYSKKDTI